MVCVPSFILCSAYFGKLGGTGGGGKKMGSCRWIGPYPWVREKDKNGKSMETLVIETRTSSLQRKRSTTELHPLNFLRKAFGEKFGYINKNGKIVDYSKNVTPLLLAFFSFTHKNR